MVELVAKKYVNALMQACSEKELTTLFSSLSKVSSAYSMQKFKTIIESPSVKQDDKVELVLSFIGRKSKKFTNLIKLLGEHDRLLLIPYITSELQRQIGIKENVYEGKVVSDWKIPQTQIKKLESGFSKKFGATVKLNACDEDFAGIKISVDDLGVEASFSVERLKAQITEHILKAI